jgi:hypothetical protein
MEHHSAMVEKIAMMREGRDDPRVEYLSVLQLSQSYDRY